MNRIVLYPDAVKDCLKDAIAVLEAARNHGPHREDLFNLTEFKRAAECIRAQHSEGEINDWSILALLLNEAAKQLKDRT
jgi:hypothetical protein